MAGIYMISAQKPTAVNQSVLGHVTGENELNLLIAKNTLLEIYKVNEEGLQFVKQISIWGIVDCLKIIRPKHEKKDLILIITAKLDIMILSLVSSSSGVGGGCQYDIITRVHGSLKDNVSRVSQINTLCSIDPTSSLIAVKSYDATLKLIAFTSESKQLNTTTTRMEDLNVIDLAFLYGYDTPTIGYLCKESNGKLSFKISEIDHRTKELTQILSKREICDCHAFIITVTNPLSGVIIVGTQSITYFNTISTSITASASSSTSDSTLRIAPSLLNYGEITTYCRIDSNGQRYLLSNVNGQLFMLFLQYNEYECTELHMELLGQNISLADNITYIDNGVVFIGSKLGDSQLIKLNDQQNSLNKSFITILETYTNLGPIMDMLIVDIEKQGQGQLITCSGANKNGSLRIIRSGIGIHEMANLEINGLKALWPLKIDSNFDNHLVLSFYDYTKILSVNGEEVEDVVLNGMDLMVQTLNCANVLKNFILQVTTRSIRLIDDEKQLLLDQWSIDDDEYISVAAISSNNCLIGSRNRLIYFEIQELQMKITKINEIKLEYEIACIDINENGTICGVGLWTDITVRLFNLPNLEQLCLEYIGGDIIPRSIVINDTPSQQSYLFVSLGDGSVISYLILNDYKELSERRKVVLGTQPTILKKFRSSPTEVNIFACSDRPSVISIQNQKLIYSSVNLKQVDCMCCINSNEYKNCLALLTENGVLRIGTMDNIQKLHIRTVLLNETPRRLAYQQETQTFGVITYRQDHLFGGVTKPIRESASTLCSNIYKCYTDLPKPNVTTTNTIPSPGTSSVFATSNDNSTDLDEYTMHSMLILDQNTFEILQSIQFQLHEFVLSIVSMNFGSDNSDCTYYICGCCYVFDDEPEPKYGRLVMFKYTNENNKLRQVSEKEIKGAPYSMCTYQTNKLLISVSNTIRLYEFNKQNEQLTQIAQFSDNVFITNLKCINNDFLLVGDVMRSCSILIYRADTNQFELVAKDNMPIWSSAIDMIDDENFILSDSFYNIVTLKKDSGQSNEDERKILQTHACVHIGEQINIFRHGSLGMQQQSNELFQQNFQSMLIAGTVSGSIILFSQLSNNMFKILNELQNKLSKFITTAGKLNYEKWRLYETDRRTENSKNFIDGDLIESFLDLNINDANAIIKDLKFDSTVTINEELNVNYFTKLIEELSRIH